MSKKETLIIAMAERCLSTIDSSNRELRAQQESLEPAHLEWMCQQVREHAIDWPPTKVHRWLGFVQGAMIANRMIDLEGAKAMFDQAKHAFGPKDVDLVDHLSPDSDFHLDIGGQG